MMIHLTASPWLSCIGYRASKSEDALREWTGSHSQLWALPTFPFIAGYEAPGAKISCGGG
jgi:hypothetical protein